MKKATAAALATTLLAATMGTVAHANLTSVSCIGYNISFDDGIAADLQSEVGSQLAFEDHVCDVTAASVPSVDGHKSIDLDLAMAGEKTRVVFFVNDKDED